MATSASGARKAPAKKATGTRSGNPAVRASAARKTAAAKAAPPAAPAGPTSVGAWRARSVTEDLALPSGNVCRVKRVGPDVLLKEGVLGDSLGPIVAKAIEKNRGLRPQDIEINSKTINEMLGGVDRVCAQVVVEPRLLLHLNEDGETIPDVNREPKEVAIYTDEVDVEDKMFIFQFVVGGTRDWERFRQESGAALGDLGLVAEDADQAK